VIDLAAGVWTVSDGRHKSGKDFKIPLSESALTILQALPRDRGEYAFLGGRTGKPLSEKVMLRVLRAMDGHSNLSVHGFRSS
jgi:integrase